MPLESKYFIIFVSRRMRIDTQKASLVVNSEQIAVTMAPEVKISCTGTWTRTAEMFEQFLCPFLDPHIEELTVRSVPYEKTLNASRMAPASMGLHMCLFRVCAYFWFIWEEGLGQSSKLSFMWEAAMTGRGKRNHLNPFSQSLLFSWEWTETAPFGPLIIHKPLHSFIAMKECYEHCKF